MFHAGQSVRPAEDLRFISGVILVSSQPWRLTEFYRNVLGLPLAEERHGEAQPHWGCELGDVHFAIHPVADYPEDPAGGPGPVKLAFMVFDLSRVVEWLDRRGIPLCYPPADLGEESRITAVRDPDGNLVELTQLGPGWLGHLKAQRADGNDLVSAWGARLAQLAEHFPKSIRTRTALRLSAPRSENQTLRSSLRSGADSPTCAEPTCLDAVYRRDQGAARDAGIVWRRCLLECRRLSIAPALVAQRIEHLTTDKCSSHGVLTCENLRHLSHGVRRIKSLKIRRVAGASLGVVLGFGREDKEPDEATSGQAR